VPSRIRRQFVFAHVAGPEWIERTIGQVLLAVLAIGCVLVLRPFFTAVCFALILVVATWPAFGRLRALLGGRRTLAALLTSRTVPATL
jgi:predicted PurR-regulated permease PerM